MDVIDFIDKDLQILLCDLELFTYNMSSYLDISNYIWARNRYKRLISRIKNNINMKEAHDQLISKIPQELIRKIFTYL